MNYAEKFLADRAEKNTQASSTKETQQDVAPATTPDNNVEGTEHVEATKTAEATQQTAEGTQEAGLTNEELDLASQSLKDVEAVPEQDNAVAKKQWDDMNHEEQRTYLDAQKKEYDKYNTQNAQANSQTKKQLEEERANFEKYINETQAYFRQQEVAFQQQQGSPQQGQEQETETEMLSRLSGIPLDEFSSDAEIATAKKIVQQEQILNETQQRREHEVRQREIDDRYNRWLSIKQDPKQNIPQTPEFEKVVFALTLAGKNYDKRYDIENGVEEAKRMMGVDNKDSFIEYAKKSEFYKDLEAQVISDIRARQAGQPSIPTPTGNISAPAPTTYKPTGNLNDSMKAFFKNRKK